MQYETLLFTRNQREDFTAFIRPALLTNKDISAIGRIFNYVNDISRLTEEFPSLYFFPLGEYLLLLRHYNSGRKHAGRAIGVIEGVAVPANDSAEFGRALASFVEQQAALLNVSGAVEDVEALETSASVAQSWTGGALQRQQETFVDAFLARRKTDRLFLPFTAEGRTTLINVLSDARLKEAPFFAFGTNSDVLAQLEKQSAVDVVSFFKTEEASFRSRKTNRVTERIGVETEDADATMSVRAAAPGDEMSLRPQAQHENVYERDAEADEDTLVGTNSVSIRSFQPEQTAASHADTDAEDEDADDGEATVLTLRQMRDRVHAEEAAASESEPEEPRRGLDPIHWLLNLFSSIVSPNKPK